MSTPNLDRAKTLAAYWGVPWHQVEITAHVTGLSHYAAMDLIAEIGAAPITGADLSGLQQPLPLEPGPSHPAPKPGPTRCPNCNQPQCGARCSCRRRKHIQKL